jgi:hypothetical protein
MTTLDSDRPSPLGAVLATTFLGSVSGGAFWAGLFFVTAQAYGFSPVRNLALASLMGVVYAIAALNAGRLARGSAPRAVLFAAFGVWTAAALAPVLWPGSELVLWVTALLGSAASATAFPVVESYLAAGRHGAEMRAAIGWFNVVWTPATALPLLVMPLLARGGPLGTLVLAAVTSALSLLGVLALPARPGTHHAEAATAAAGPEYRWLARSTSWLLPLSYVMSATLSPVLPHRMAAVGITAAPSVVAALWMVARFATLFTLWRTGFWHGRWATLAVAGAALAGGLALVLTAASPPVLVLGLLTFGTGMGITYYAALYYSMTVGHAAVEAGGNFEALIGLGYFVGPLLGIGANLITGATRAGSLTVMLTWAVVAIGSRGVIRPYLQARRSRRG